MTTDILVIAGDHRQFIYLCDQGQESWDQELKERRVHYVSRWEDLVGRPGCRVFLYGTYNKRRDWPEIRSYLATHPEFRVLPMGGINV